MNKATAVDEIDANPTERQQTDEDGPCLSTPAEEKAPTSVRNVELPQVYDFYPKRGVAVIVCQENFNGMKRRDECDADRKAIMSVVKFLGFEVRVLNDPDRMELITELKKVADEDHSEHHCLLVIVMTHGQEKILHAHNYPYPMDILFEIFDGKNCESLCGKPKLFFVQASTYTSNGGAEPYGSSSTQLDAKNVSKHQNPVQYCIPTMADLLVVCSSYEMNIYSIATRGTLFIEALCEELKTNADHLHILQMLTNVSQKMSGWKCKPMPCFISSLTKELYFSKKQ